MMTNNPIISIIVPVYKVEPYLDRCIRSIVEQTYTNLEILLVDDGSPDRCGEICDAWAEKDSRIRVIHKENGGAGLARNVALDEAKGSLFGFLDSDDFIAPDMYRQLLSLLNDEVDIAECGICEVVGDVFPEESGSGEVSVYGKEEAMRFHIHDEMFRQTVWNKLYKRNVIGEIRFPEGNLIDDEFFTYRVIGNANKLARLENNLYAYRQQPNSVMHRPFSVKRMQGLQAICQRLDYLRENMPELVNEAKCCLFITCLAFMQDSIRYLREDELKKAKASIYEALRETDGLRIQKSSPLKRKLLFNAAQTDFERTCRLLNFLQDIHILT